LYANMMTLRFELNEPPLVGWPTLGQIFSGKKIKSIYTSLVRYEEGKFHLICAFC